MWFAPRLVDSKPNIAFIRGFHTPIIEVESSNYPHTLALDSDGMNTLAMIEIVKLCTEFKHFIKRPDDMFTDHIQYDGVISEDLIDEKYHLILKDVRGLFLVGPYDPESMPQELQNLVNYHKKNSGGEPYH